MLKDNTRIDLVFQLLFYLLCAFYIILYMPFGFENTDTGYIFGSSWNIYNGVFPHGDFIYTRPAIPAFFHTVFLFISETYGYLLDRSFFYVQVFAYSFLGAKLLAQNFFISQKSIIYFIAIIGAILSIHNYPPMGWNTIDGVFFCMIGIYLLLEKDSKIPHLFFGSIVLAMGVLSKQSFYFMPVFVFIYFLIKKEYHRLKYYSLFGIIAILLYGILKYATDSFFPFWEQTFQRTSSSALIDAGIKTYYLALKFNFFYLLAAGILIWLASKFISKKAGFILLNIIIVVYIITFFTTQNVAWSVIPYLFQLLWMASAGYALLMVLQDKRFLLVLLLLALSWSASISNGYRTPIHFSLPIFFSIYAFFFLNENKRPHAILSSSFIVLYLATFFIGYQTLYRDSSRKNLDQSMGTVFPQLKFIKSDTETFEKYSELKSFAKKYPNFTAVPSMTLAHYLTNTINPIGTDWPHDLEINHQAQSLVEILEQKKTFVFVETSGFNETELEDYQIKSIIESQWQLIEQGNYFVVYAPAK